MRLRWAAWFRYRAQRFVEWIPWQGLHHIRAYERKPNGLFRLREKRLVAQKRRQGQEKVAKRRPRRKIGELSRQRRVGE